MKRLLIKTIEKINNNPEEFIKNKIRTIPNFPKPGIMFRDITTLLYDVEGMNKVIEIFFNRYKDKKIDIILSVEARGFIF